MDKLKILLEKEIDTLLIQMPEKEGRTINSMLQRVQFVADNQELLKSRFNAIGNEFFKDEKLTDEERNEIENLLNTYFIKFSQSFA